MDKAEGPTFSRRYSYPAPGNRFGVLEIVLFQVQNRDTCLNIHRQIVPRPQLGKLSSLIEQSPRCVVALLVDCD